MGSCDARCGVATDEVFDTIGGSADDAGLLPVRLRPPMSLLPPKARWIADRGVCTFAACCCIGRRRVRGGAGWVDRGVTGEVGKPSSTSVCVVLFGITFGCGTRPGRITSSFCAAAGGEAWSNVADKEVAGAHEGADSAVDPWPTTPEARDVPATIPSESSATILAYLLSLSALRLLFNNKFSRTCFCGSQSVGDEGLCVNTRRERERHARAHLFYGPLPVDDLLTVATAVLTVATYLVSMIS